MNFAEEYKRKLKTPEEAVKLVKDGDWVDYSVGIGFPVLLDAALGKRKDELRDIKIDVYKRQMCSLTKPAISTAALW